MSKAEPARPAAARIHFQSIWRRRIALLSVAGTIAVLPLVFTDAYWRTNLIVCALNVMLALGLDFMLGYAGQLNLGHSAFYGLGAYVSTLLIAKLGVPFWIAFASAVAFSGLAGVMLSLFAIRLRGHYLAIASLSFAVITHQILLNWISLTQGPLGIYAIAPPPPLVLPGLPVIDFHDLANLFYLLAGFALLSYLLLDQLVRSPIGETLTAIREDEISAASLGVNCGVWKVFAFGVSSAIAGTAGCFYASFVGTLVPDAFFVTESFTILAMVVVGGMGTLIGPVCGAILLTVLPEFLRGIGDLRLVVYGVAVTLVVLFIPGGIVQVALQMALQVARFVSARLRRFVRPSTGSTIAQPPSPGLIGRSGHHRPGALDCPVKLGDDRERLIEKYAEAAGIPPATMAKSPDEKKRATPNPGVLLHVRGLHKRFGGVHAVRDISFAVPEGAIFAVIGPNGAGKSTLLNLLSGIYRPDAGSIVLDGIDLIGLPAHRRVRRGIARTFQKIRLFPHLSAIENVAAGCHIRHDIPLWQYLIHGPAFRRNFLRYHEEAARLLAFMGIEHRAHIPADSLSYGEKRMLEIARALATAPRLLMVDEPAAGLNAAEVETLLDRLQALRRNGVTLCVVEHNMDLVMNIADRVLVIDYGQYLFEGAPAEVQAHAGVIDAYLGGPRQ